MAATDRMPRLVRIALGLAVIAAGAALVVSPLAVADALGSAHDTGPQRINLRASYGGTIVGLGLFVAWIPSPPPRWSRLLVGLLGCAMLGIGLARLVGFAVDGSPDARQYVWLVAEAAIVLFCAVVLRRR
jgi:Domain of unknown function (DUF4345)